MKKLLIIGIVCLTMVSCARNLSSDHIVDINTTGKVIIGTIINKRNVTISGTDKLSSGQMGSTAGMVSGAAVGSVVGGGSGQILTTIGMGILGGVLGASAEEKFSTQQGIEYIIEKDNHEVISIAQDQKNQLSIGQKVYIISYGYGKNKLVAAN